jgi:hypothetical protein
MKVGLNFPARNGNPPNTDVAWSYPKFTVFRDAQHLFSDVALYTDGQSTITGNGEAERVRSEIVGARYLPTLGVRPAIGRNFLPVRLLATFDPSQALRVQTFSAIGAVSFSNIRLDGEALAFAACLAIATGLLFGLVPALQSTRSSLTGALKEEAGGGDGARRTLSSRNVLAIVEIALAVVLLAGSGLMLRSLGKLLRVNPGFDPEKAMPDVYLSYYLVAAVTDDADAALSRLAASWIPARRAATIHPSEALRES